MEINCTAMAAGRGATHNHVNIESMTIFLNIVQESQELLGSLRHAARGLNRLLTTPA